MNMIRYRILLDRAFDEFAKENFEEIFTKDNLEELNQPAET